MENTSDSNDFSDNSSPINAPFTLPCGVTLKNRIAKAALTERLAKPDHLPFEKHFQLYETWAQEGGGLLLTGNIVVDKRYLESSGNVVIEENTPREAFLEWTKSGTQNGTQLWAQIGHAGRQSTIFSTLKPVSASNVKLNKVGLFAKPRALRLEEIKDIEKRFVHAAKFCQEVGFTGIQLHAAHGYLLSQFLSPKTNKRTDEYGGSLENRARLLVNIVTKIRKAVGDSFPISVKLNSADFQRGGFEEDDALQVIQWINDRGIDLLEISGGTYEDVTFFTQKGVKQSTKDREAYFLDFAKKVRAQSQVPIMVTGGFRTLSFCNKVIADEELDIVGFGRPFLLVENFAGGFLDGTLEKVVDPEVKSLLSMFYDFTLAGYYDYQILQIAEGKKINLDYPGWLSLFRMTKNEFWKGIQNRIYG